MNEIIQSLEANATNGEENFCYISENKLNAIKELSKREQQEKEDLQKQNAELKEENKELHNRIDKAIDYLEQETVIEINGEFRNIYSEDDDRLLKILKDGDY